MESERRYTTIKKNGSLNIKNLPFKKGQRVEIILLPEEIVRYTQRFLTGKELTQSDIVGLWKNRRITDSVEYSCKLRAKAEKRSTNK